MNNSSKLIDKKINECPIKESAKEEGKPAAVINGVEIIDNTKDDEVKTLPRNDMIEYELKLI